MKKLFLVSVVLLFCVANVNAEMITLNAPGATKTYARGISGANVVGYYDDASGGEHGFIYNGGTWTTLDMPDAVSSTDAFGISGNNIVGQSDASSHSSFLFDGTNWNTVSVPGASSPNAVSVMGVFGNSIVGSYSTLSGYEHGFSLINGTRKNIDVPNADGTWVSGIFGNNLVGTYDDVLGGHSFLYDGTNYTTLNAPGSATGISGDYIVGNYWDNNGGHYHGFLYNGGSWTALDMPGATRTFVYGIDGSNIVGEYQDASGIHGFVSTVPEPSTCVLLIAALATGTLLRRRK